MDRKQLLVATAALLVQAVLMGHCVSAAAVEYRFGVVPQFEPRKLHGIWKPIVDELARRSGLTFHLDTTLKVDEFEKEFMKGGFDFVYMNPYLIASTSSTLGYVPLVRDKVPMRGILVVRKDSPVGRIEDVAGRTVVFPTPNAPAGCLLMKAELKENHGITFSSSYVNTASNVFLQVAKGLADAGGAPEKTFQVQPPELRDLLRVLYTTRPMPPHPVAAHPRVPEKDREAVRAALIGLMAEETGRSLLAAVPIKEAVAATAAEYQELNSLGLEKYRDPSWQGD